MDLITAYHRLADIREWAESCNLVAGSMPAVQFTKLVAVTGQLVSAINDSDFDGSKGAVGDGFVALTILAAQCGFQLERHLDDLPMFSSGSDRNYIPVVLGALATAIATEKYDQALAPLLLVATAFFWQAYHYRISINDCIERAWAKIKKEGA